MAMPSAVGQIPCSTERISSNDNILQGYVTSSKEEMSQLAAELYAIICVDCHDASSVDLVTVVKDLLNDTDSKVCTLVKLLS